MNDDHTTETDRLRRTMRAVADAHQLDADGWSTVRDRLASGHTGTRSVPVVPVGSATSRGGGRSRRFLAAAAALLVVAGTAIAVSRDRGDSTVSTGVPTAEPTGWYVPVGLPAGWTLEEVTLSRIEDECPCRTTVWSDAAWAERVWVATTPVPAADSEPAFGGDAPESVDLDGVAAELHRPSSGGEEARWELAWDLDGLRHRVTAVGVRSDRAVEIGRRLVADHRASPLPGQVVRGEHVERGTQGRDVQIDVAMSSPAGHRVGYSLQADSAVSEVDWLLAFGPDTVELPGQPLPMLVPAIGDRSSATDRSEVARFLGRWPGATVRSADVVEMTEDRRTIPSADEVRTLMGSLRPTSFEGWRRFVAGSENRDAGLTSSATLADLVAGRDREATDEGPAPTPMSSRLDDLDLVVSAEPRLAGWEDAGIVLQVSNPTDRTIEDATCALDRARGALVAVGSDEPPQPSGTSLADPWFHADEPCDGGLVLEPGDTKELRIRVLASYADERYGPLPTGSYRATVAIDGIVFRPSTPVQVAGTDCPPTPDGTDDAYLGLDLGEALARAATVGDELRDHTDAPPNANGGRDRCDRINVVIEEGTIRSARRY